MVSTLGYGSIYQGVRTPARFQHMAVYGMNAGDNDR